MVREYLDSGLREKMGDDTVRQPRLKDVRAQ